MATTSTTTTMKREKKQLTTKSAKVAKTGLPDEASLTEPTPAPTTMTSAKLFSDLLLLLEEADDTAVDNAFVTNATTEVKVGNDDHVDDVDDDSMRKMSFTLGEKQDRVNYYDSCLG